MAHCVLDGKPMTSKEFLALLDDLERNGPIPAGQSDEEAEAAWKRFKGEANGQR